MATTAAPSPKASSPGPPDEPAPRCLGPPAAVAGRVWRSRMSLTGWWMEAAELTDHVERSGRFLDLHHGERSLLLPNPWDRGSARLLARLGFQALATTGSGFAATWAGPTGR